MAATSLETFLADCPALLFVARADGELARVSGALERRLGHRLGDARSLAALAGPDDGPALAAFLATFASASASESEAECVLHCTEADGTGVELRCVARRGADGALFGRVEPCPAPARPTQQERLDHQLLRVVLDNLDLTIWVIDQDGAYVLQDGKALPRTGMEPNQFRGVNVFDLTPELAEQWVAPPLAGQRVEGAAESHGVHWHTWAVPLKLDDDRTWCAGVSLDVTERVESQRKLEQQLETVRLQQAAIHELSAPVLNVWDHVLAVPLIGIMDSQRTNELTNRLLDAAHQSQTRFAILDLTGVEAVDTSIAGHVLRLLESLRLLGVDGLVTGVSPEVAKTMVEVGIDFEDVQTHRTLREGLRHCMRQLLESQAG